MMLSPVCTPLTIIRSICRGKDKSVQQSLLQAQNAPPFLSKPRALILYYFRECVGRLSDEYGPPTGLMILTLKVLAFSVATKLYSQDEMRQQIFVFSPSPYAQLG